VSALRTRSRRIRSASYAPLPSVWGSRTSRFTTIMALAAKGRDKRPEFDRQFDMIMAWSVDRLGRSLPHLVEFLIEIHSLKVDLYLHQQGIDTTTPYAMFGMASAEWHPCTAALRPRLTAILRLDKPLALSRNTSRVFRMGSLSWGMPSPLERRASNCRFEPYPTGVAANTPQPGRHRSEPVVVINWNHWSPSIGTGGRHHVVRAP
jgi:Resolvase, N terminal domain